MQMFYVDNDKGVITKSDVQTKIDGIIETVKRGLTEIFLNSPLLSLPAILRDL